MTLEPLVTPFSWRPSQKETVDKIVSAIESGTRTIVLEAPVGFGKTIVNTAVARHFQTRQGWTTYYTTPQVLLVDQIRRDPLVNDFFRVVYGKGNYPCLYARASSREEFSVAEGWCESPPSCVPCDGRGVRDDGTECPACYGTGRIPAVDPCPHRPFCVHRPDRAGDPTLVVCSYFADRARALTGPAALTFDYLVHVTRSASADPEKEERYVRTPCPKCGSPRTVQELRFRPRSLLIIDEAHGLGEVGRMLSVQLHAERIHHPAWFDWWDRYGEQLLTQKDQWYESLSADVLHEVLGSAHLAATRSREQFARDPLLKGETPAQRARKETIAKNFVIGLEVAIDDLDKGNAWVAQPDPDKKRVVASPVRATAFLKRRIWPLAPVRILSTGTILDVPHYLATIGLDGERYLHLAPLSSFPPERAPIYLRPSVDLTWRRKKANLPRAIALLDELLDAHADRGIVHAHSYEFQRAIYDTSRHQGRMHLHDPESRNEMLTWWVERSPPGSVLVSVAMQEGIDLAYDRARWQVVFKAPWGDLKNRRIRFRRRESDGERWYLLECLKGLLQAFGRVMRAEDDFGVTHVLDSSAGRVLVDNWSLLPEWARARVEAATRIPFPHAAPP